MADKIDDLKKLEPRERLAKLKELEKKNKEEIEKARKMMSESEREVAIEDELKEIPIPEVRAIDIDHLFSPEAKEVWKMKRFDEGKNKRLLEEEAEAKAQKAASLEETVAEEARRSEEFGRQQVQYGTAIEEVKSMAEKLTNAYGVIKEMVEKEYLSSEEQKRLESYSEMASTLYEQKFSPEHTVEREKMLAVEKMLYDARIK